MADIEVRAAKDSVIPLHTPIRCLDGTIINEVIVPKGTPVLTHYQASNVDPNLWGEDAYEWKPERWLRPLPPTNIPGVLANTYVPQVHLCAFADETTG